jgi:hypothetical protein
MPARASYPCCDHAVHSGNATHQRDMDAAVAASKGLPQGECRTIKSPYNEKAAMAEVGDRPKNQVKEA